MSTPATDHLRNLLSAVQAEQSGPLDVTKWKDALGLWSFCGSRAQTIPSDATGFSAGTVVAYGSEFTVTETMLRNSVNRHGQSRFAEALMSEDAQIAHYGEIAFKRGGWPTGALRTRPGDADHERDAQDLRLAATQISDPDKRAAELRRIRDLYGDAYFSAGSKSREMTRYRGGDGRDALSQPGQ